MKQFFLLLSCVLFITNCSHLYFPQRVNADLLDETWMHDMQMHPIKAMGPQTIKPIQEEFSDIQLAGSFSVIIDDQAPLNTVTVTGSPTLLPCIAVYARDHILFVMQDPHQPVDLSAMVVHIHAQHVQRLTHVGNGNMMIHGHVGLQSIQHEGAGEITVSSLESPCLDIQMYGGKMIVKGNIRLRHLNVSDNSCVYLYWITAHNIDIYAEHNARIGLAGIANNVNIELRDEAQLEGQYLRSNNTYVATHNVSHANVAATEKIFASASDKSSIYTFARPGSVSRYMKDQGTVISLYHQTNLSRHQRAAMPWNDPGDKNWR